MWKKMKISKSISRRSFEGFQVARIANGSRYTATDLAASSVRRGRI